MIILQFYNKPLITMIFAELYNSREEISTFGPDTKTCVIMVAKKNVHIHVKLEIHFAHITFFGVSLHNTK